MAGLHVEIDREADGRWIAEIPGLPGVMAYGDTESAAILAAVKLALEVVSDKPQLSQHPDKLSLRVPLGGSVSV